jgi:hypothetical protein
MPITGAHTQQHADSTKSCMQSQKVGRWTCSCSRTCAVAGCRRALKLALGSGHARAICGLCKPTEYNAMLDSTTVLAHASTLRLAAAAVQLRACSHSSKQTHMHMRTDTPAVMCILQHTPRTISSSTPPIWTIQCSVHARQSVMPEQSCSPCCPAEDYHGVKQGRSSIRSNH